MNNLLYLDPDKKILKGRKYFIYLDGLYLEIILEAISCMSCKNCHFLSECGLKDSLCADIRKVIVQIIDKQAGIEELKIEEIVN